MNKLWPGAAALATLLTACGGGGGGVAPGPAFTISLSPARIDARPYQGDFAQFHVVGSLAGNIPSSGYVGVSDGAQVFDTPITIVQEAFDRYSATLTVNNAAPGTYRSTLSIMVCSDPNCANVLASSSLPYDITILSNTNLTPLSALPGATDWTTAGGNAAHTGYVPVTLDPARFTSRWRQQIDYAADDPVLPEVVTVGGNAYSPIPTDISGTFRFAEFTDADGTLRTGDMASGRYSSFTIDGDRLLAITHNSGGKLLAWNRSTGHVTLANPYPAATQSYFEPMPPTVLGGSIFAASSSAGWGTSAFASDGTAAWEATQGGEQGTTPATDGTGLYVAGPKAEDFKNFFYSVNPATGATLWEVDLSDTTNFGYTPVAVPGTSQVLVGADSGLIAIDTSTHAIQWKYAGVFNQRPAVANGVAYATTLMPDDTIALEAHRLSDGALLWSWNGGARAFNSLGYDFKGGPLVTDNIVFFSCDTGVHALSLTTHQEVWSYPHAGRLSMSANGLLYVMRQSTARGTGAVSDGYLAAINLH